MAQIQPEAFDLVVIGTGLEESLIAAYAFSPQLHAPMRRGTDLISIIANPSTWPAELLQSLARQCCSLTRLAIMDLHGAV